MLSSPRRPSSAIRILSSAEKCRRVARRISLTTCSAGFFVFVGFVVILLSFVSQTRPELSLTFKPNSVPRALMPDSYDNAMVETFFKTIKSELIWRTRFQTMQDAQQAIARYIDGLYNQVRRHSALGYQSPVQFENCARQTS
jgi:hypothetical protein